MAKRITRNPPAAALIRGIRSIGYSFATSVADIIDNSITANASDINIIFDPLDSKPYFCICDNGYGMTSDELLNAMTFGSDRSDKIDTELDLGRFGLGLKSASLSQCRELIVISKKHRRMNALSYNLDEIETTNEWQLIEFEQEELKDFPCVNFLDDKVAGTIVIWRKFDKLEENAKKFEDSFRSSVEESKKHVEFVFHRFYNDINIFYNNKRIEFRDPFLISSPGHQVGRTTEISIGDSKITVKPYTLPFANKLTSEEKALLGNPKSIYDLQGFYLYRNKRLIVWGSWLKMNVRSELNKLARVLVDFPSNLDSMWSLDVKKSSAKIPDKIKESLNAAISDSTIRSRKATRYPGVKERSKEIFVWNRINLREGQIKYEINRTNPTLEKLVDMIGDNERELLISFIEQLEMYLPKHRINLDSIDANTIVNTGDDQEVDRLLEEAIKLLGFFKQEDRETKLNIILQMENFDKLKPYEGEIRKRVCF